MAMAWMPKRKHLDQVQQGCVIPCAMIVHVDSCSTNTAHTPCGSSLCEITGSRLVDRPYEMLLWPVLHIRTLDTAAAALW